MTILRPQALHASRKGLTLFECLVAILVVNLAIVMLTMPLAIVAATRLRNDRINKASEVARQSLDRLRAMMEQGVDVREDSSGLLPPQATEADLNWQPHPTSVVECTGEQWFASGPDKACLQRVGIHEFAVQIIRGPVATSASQVLCYPVQVRVYERRAIKNMADPDFAGPIEAQPVLFTAASDQIEAPNRENPLAVLSTYILRADSGEVLSSVRSNSLTSKAATVNSCAPPSARGEQSGGAKPMESQPMESLSKPQLPQLPNGALDTPKTPTKPQGGQPPQEQNDANMASSTSLKN